MLGYYLRRWCTFDNEIIFRLIDFVGRSQKELPSPGLFWAEIANHLFESAKMRDLSYLKGAADIIEDMLNDSNEDLQVATISELLESLENNFLNSAPAAWPAVRDALGPEARRAIAHLDSLYGTDISWFQAEDAH